MCTQYNQFRHESGTTFLNVFLARGHPEDPNFVNFGIGNRMMTDRGICMTFSAGNGNEERVCGYSTCATLKYTTICQ